jgi:hypothetical protein
MARWRTKDFTMLIPRLLCASLLAVVLSTTLSTIAGPAWAAQGYGEGCSLFNQCDDGLSCQPFKHKCYTSPREVGEPCSAGFGCGDGLTCKLFRCVPADLEWNDDQRCKAFYSENIASRVRAKKMAKSFGQGSTFSLPLTGSLEIGVVYGANGEFGCYETTCGGFGHDLAFGTFAAFSQLDSFDSFAGRSQVYAAGASVPIVEIGGSVGIVLAERDGGGVDPVGTVQTLGVGLGFLPASISPLRCTTEVNVVDVGPRRGPIPEPGVRDEFVPFGKAYPRKDGGYVTKKASNAAACAQACNDLGEACRAFYFHDGGDGSAGSERCKLSPFTTVMEEGGLITDELKTRRSRLSDVDFQRPHEYYEREAATKNGVPDAFTTDNTTRLLDRDVNSARFAATHVYFYADDGSMSEAMGRGARPGAAQAASLTRRTFKYVGKPPQAGFDGTWSLFGAIGETVLHEDPSQPVAGSSSLFMRDPDSRDRIIVDFEHGVVRFRPADGGKERRFPISAIHQMTDETRATAQRMLTDGCLSGRDKCVACPHGKIGLDPKNNILRLYGDDGKVEWTGNSTETIGILHCPQGGVLVSLGGKHLFYSPDCRNPFGGGRTIKAYDGPQTLRGWTKWEQEGITGVATSFQPNMYFSPDCRNLGGGGNTRRLKPW